MEKLAIKKAIVDSIQYDVIREGIEVEAIDKYFSEKILHTSYKVFFNIIEF